MQYNLVLLIPSRVGGRTPILELMKDLTALIYVEIITLSEHPDVLSTT